MLRRIELGMGTWGSTLDRELAERARLIPVCVEMTAPIRDSSPLFAGDVLLYHVGQIVNVIASIYIATSRLCSAVHQFQSIADVYKGAKP